ncbi:MAG TPA: histidine kinase dimerization/phospho-acceptor domain-containing protein [Micromonosporaceae bacterium]
MPFRPPSTSGSLTARAILTTCLAALISVLVTALVAFPLSIRAANSQARSALAEKATIAEALLARGGGANRPEVDVRLLRNQHIDIYLIRNGRPDRAGLPPRVVAAIASGQSVRNAKGIVDGRGVLIEGRVLPDGAAGGIKSTGNGVVLTQTRAAAIGASVAIRLGLALLAGLIAGGLAGALLARRLARPIRNAAVAAARLSAGDRTVRVTPEPPAEVEDLAHALNDLGAALAVSEGRQRDFLLSISHELRTPLTSLKGYAEALSDGVVGPDEARKAGQTMLVEAGNLERLVTDLLSLARLEAADFPVETVPVELIQLANDVLGAWSGRWAANGLVAHLELPDVPVIVYTDPGRLRQVIDGLLENALRVVPAGAPIVLAVRGPNPAAPHHGFIEVRDGGPGFTDSDLAVVFERGALYERYRGTRKVGSGLGLALAAGLVRRLGGGIEAGHAPEGGARFTVAMPTLTARRQAVEHRSGARSADRRGAEPNS